MDDRDLVRDLVGWYRASARVLPWRSDPTPWRVLLSELMLQQTRVDTVIPYFERFVARWPRIEDLAAADVAEVVEAWAGLGYYRRARNLHACAVAAAARGGLPSERDQLEELPGIGPYTAGAVASIAFGRRAPLVDGNVERVLSRLDARDADPRSPDGRRALWERAEALQRAWDGHPGDLNQALMELGATICTPRAPSCPACPLAAACAGRERGDVESLPRKVPKAAPAPIAGVAGVARVGERLLLGRRHPGGLLGGLWEPIRAELPEGADPAAALAEAFRDVGLEVRVGPRVGEVVHVFTHRRLTCAVHAVAITGGAAKPGGPYELVAEALPDAVGLSTLARKLLDLTPPPQLALPLAADAE